MMLTVMRESVRMRDVQSPVIPVVGEMIRSHPGTISLGQGVVGYGPPQVEVYKKLIEFWEDGENQKYKPVNGIPQLVEALGRKVEQENRIPIGQQWGNRVFASAGGNMAFSNAILCIADPGDEVILPKPYYFNHEMAIAMASCKAVGVETDEAYQLKVEAMEAAITPRTRAIVTVSPNNPTGAVYPRAALAAVNQLCKKRGIYHIHDEVYEYFLWEGAEHYSPASELGTSWHTISIYSLSKAYGFASWRIGYAVIPEHLFDAMRKAQDTVLVCPPVISQFAALGALEAGKEWCREQMGEIEAARGVVKEELGRLGDKVVVPEARGAFYFLLKVNTKLGAMELVDRLIKEHGVAVLPGTTFGMQQGCYVRVSYGALRYDTAAEGVERLLKGIEAIVG